MKFIISKSTRIQLIGGAVAVIGIGGVFFADFLQSKSDDSALRSLENQELSFDEYANFFQELAERKGAEHAFETLLRAPLAPGTDLHLLGHVVGDVLYKQQGIKGIKICTPDFRNACSHSIVVGLFTEQGVQALDDISEACRNAPGGAGAYTMCFHGLGHGILAYTGYDMEKAVQLCKETGTPERQNREYAECVGGTMMEMVAGINDQNAWELEKDNYFLPNDPLAPCNMSFITGEARSFCYAYLTPHLFEAAGGNLASPEPDIFEKAFTFCNQIPESNSNDRNACYGGFGKEFVVLAQDRDVRDIGSMQNDALQKVRDWCALAHDSTGEIVCNANALASLFWGGENNPDASFRFCAIESNQQLQNECYRQLSEMIPYFLKESRTGESLCKQLPESYQHACLLRL